MTSPRGRIPAARQTRHPVAGRQHERDEPPAARQHQHQQPGDREGDDGVPGGEAQPMVWHPAQDRVGHRRPGPLPLHQLLGDPLEDELQGHHQHQRRDASAPAATTGGMASTPGTGRPASADTASRAAR
jgi:hypothetical protein